MQATCWFWQAAPQHEGVPHSQPSALLALQLEKPGLQVSTPFEHAPLSGLHVGASRGASCALASLALASLGGASATEASGSEPALPPLASTLPAPPPAPPEEVLP